MAHRLADIALFILFIFLVSLAHHPASAAGEDAEITLGESIFKKGVGRDGREIGGTLPGGVTLTGKPVACSGCHGEDARGGGESFIRAPDIRWAELSKSRPARRLGRTGSSYDPATFSRVLRSGVTAAGAALDPAMPRFDLADDEITGLIAYLSAIGSAPAGTNSRPAVLGLLPEPGQSMAADRLGRKLKSCLPASRNERIAAVDVLYFHDPADAIAKLEQRIQKNAHSIILAPYLLGWEPLYLKASARWPVKTVLPFSFLDPASENNWYYHFPGLQTQVLALLRYAKAGGYSHVRLLYHLHDELGSKLAYFSEKAALQYRMTVMANDGIPAGPPSRTASLWLTPVTDTAFSPDADFGELALVPALFHKTGKTHAAALSEQTIRWAIAYPYPPRKPDGTLRNPIDVWGAAACEFLIHLDEISVSPGTSREVMLRWDEGQVLQPKPDLEQAIGQVMITDEQGEPITRPESNRR